MKQIGTANHELDVFRDPFKKTKIESVSLNYSRVMFETYFSWVGRIYFSNGDTSGSQKFEVTDQESEDAFGTITRQIQQFINSLD